MTGPRVAVVVPCHDDGDTLGELLASLHDQEPHELVIVDDGSTDPATLAAFERLEQGGTRVFHQRNAGLSAARMAGVAATSAPYVMPLDADDAIAPGAVAALADALDAQPDAAAAWGRTEVFGELEVGLEVAESFDPWLLTYLNEIPVATLVRRSALLESGGWSMGSGYEDWDLWLAFAERGLRGLSVPCPVWRYRRHSGRMLEGTIPRHAELTARLRERHPALWSARRRNRRASRAPLRVKLFFPLVDGLPLRPFDRHRLYLLIRRPRQVLSLRRLRRAAAA